LGLVGIHDDAGLSEPGKRPSFAPPSRAANLGKTHRYRRSWPTHSGVQVALGQGNLYCEHVFNLYDPGEIQFLPSHTSGRVRNSQRQPINSVLRSPRPKREEGRKHHSRPPIRPAQWGFSYPCGKNDSVLQSVTAARFQVKISRSSFAKRDAPQRMPRRRYLLLDGGLLLDGEAYAVARSRLRARALLGA
jgi:hypothetical protein